MLSPKTLAVVFEYAEDNLTYFEWLGILQKAEVLSNMEIPAAAELLQQRSKEAMSQLITQAVENDNISTLYLVDESGTFCGAIDLKDLIVAREGTPLSDITTVSYPYLYTKAPIEDCIPFIADYAESSIPVLDDDNKLLGVVIAQDFVEILDDELGDDYEKLAGLSS